jgi:cobalt/nickel transport system permease protein
MFDRASHHGTSHGPEPAPGGSSYLGRVDPRARVVAAVGLAVVVATVESLAAAAIALGVALLALALARLPAGAVWRRLLPLEIVILALAMVLPWSAPAGGQPHHIPPLAAAIALKANAVLLGLLALLGGMEAATLGHALAHLRVPKKLVHLLLLTVSYLDVLGREYGRLRAAMRVRCFRPRVNGHTYRSYGYLVGMLLVRSFDRAERVLAAMKCRGFRGRFYLLDHFHFVCRRDLPFSLAAAVLLAAIVALEWL